MQEVDYNTTITGPGKRWHLAKMARQLEYEFVVRFGPNAAFCLQRPKFNIAYRVDGNVQRNQNSTVVRATRWADGVPCIIKVVNPAKESMLDRELHLLKPLRHPKIVGLIEIRDDYDDDIAIVLESGIDPIGKFASNLRAKDIQQSTKFIRQLACLWNADIVDAISHIHSLGICHRDMKPENIVIFQTAAGWVAKLIDFGIARGSDEAVIPGWGDGTPRWMAPLTFMQHPDDRYVDCYGVGRVLADTLGFQYQAESRKPKVFCLCNPTCQDSCVKKVEFWDHLAAQSLGDDCLDFLKGLIVSKPESCMGAAAMESHHYVVRGKRICRRLLTSLAEGDRIAAP